MKERSKDALLRRIGERSDGWFAVVPIEATFAMREVIEGYARAINRDPDVIGMEGGCGMAGKSTGEWLGRLRDWESVGASHLCLRTLGGELSAREQLDLMQDAHRTLGLEGIRCT